MGVRNCLAILFLTAGSMSASAVQCSQQELDGVKAVGLSGTDNRLGGAVWTCRQDIVAALNRYKKDARPSDAKEILEKQNLLNALGASLDASLFFRNSPVAVMIKTFRNDYDGAIRSALQGPQGRDPAHLKQDSVDRLLDIADQVVPVLQDKGALNKRAAAQETDLDDAAGQGRTAKPEEYIDVAQQYMAGGKPKDAERAAEKSLKAKEDNPGALSIRAAARLSQGNNEGALADARKTLALDPENKTAQEIVGYLHPAPDLDGKVKLRKPDFGAMLNPESNQAGLGPARQSGGESSGMESPQPVFQPGRVLTPSEAFMQKASAKMGLHDYTKALLYATQAIDGDPKNAKAWALRAEVSKSLKNYPAAVKDATEALKLDPKNAQALRARSNAEYEMGDFQKAYADADAAIALEPENALGYLYRAMAEEKLGDVKNAIRDYQRAEALDPSLKPLCDEALNSLGIASEGARMSATTLPKKFLFRGGAIAASLVLILLGLEGGRRVATTLKRRKEERQAPAPRLADGTIDCGTVLGGNFRIVGELGRGGMGVVYEGFDLALQRRVAIKQLQGDADSTKEDLERFLKEARMMAKLKHPNLAEIYSIIEDADCYLVFEYIDGHSLDAVLARKGRLPLQETRKLLGDICEALDYAHAQKIIHRDLKPANIMVGSDGRAKVLDFGIAHQSQGMSGQTLTSASGTPPYMAPEQGFGSASPAADIYALGVMTYELLTGARPFKGQDLLGDKLAERFPPAHEAEATLPRSLDGFFSAVLKADPTKRLPDGESFLKAFDAAVETKAPA